MSQIPFKFGEIVTGDYFTNRELEIKQLHRNFRDLQNTIIISPRRYGKSSLVKVASEQFLKNTTGYLFCFLDLMYIYSEEEFYSQFAGKVIRATSNKVEEIIQLTKKFLKGARLTVNTGTGEPSLEFGLNFIEDNIEQILNLPQVIAERKKRKLIICIDEFQNISKLDVSQKIQGRLRSVWQHHSHVGYLLYGSKHSMMKELFNRTNSPFYRFGEIIYLKRIHQEALRVFLQKAFRSTGKVISGEQCNEIIALMEMHPYYIQQFARNIWLISGQTVTRDDIREAVNVLISDNLNLFNELLDGLSHYQARFLTALLNQEEHLYSTGVLQRYRLGSSANTRRLYNSFVKKGIIVKEDDRIVFTDPVFKLIARQKLLGASA